MSKVSIRSSKTIVCPKCNGVVWGYNIGLAQNKYHAHWSLENQKWEVVSK